MTDKEKIIAEIERRYNQNNDKLTKIPEYCDEASILRMVCAEDLYFRDFINSLPAEQPREDLEKAANLYANKQGLELKPFARRFFIAGANWQKEQMMKSAVNGCYIKRNKYTKQNVLNGLSVTCEAIQKFRDGDKVKVIIIKEDEQ